MAAAVIVGLGLVGLAIVGGLLTIAAGMHRSSRRQNRAGAHFYPGGLTGADVLRQALGTKGKPR